ncbi:hypothetical protein PENNAL_c0321G11370, partial [Penicillium nalgiovense]
METDAVSDFDSPPTQPEEKCQKCAVADEERLYDRDAPRSYYLVGYIMIA